MGSAAGEVLPSMEIASQELALYGCSINGLLAMPTPYASPSMRVPCLQTPLMLVRTRGPRSGAGRQEARLPLLAPGASTLTRAALPAPPAA